MLLCYSDQDMNKSNVDPDMNKSNVDPYLPQMCSYLYPMKMFSSALCARTQQHIFFQ